jgi:hypothetical protein
MGLRKLLKSIISGGEVVDIVNEAIAQVDANTEEITKKATKNGDDKEKFVSKSLMFGTGSMQSILSYTGEELSKDIILTIGKGFAGLMEIDISGSWNNGHVSGAIKIIWGGALFNDKGIETKKVIYAYGSVAEFWYVDNLFIEDEFLKLRIKRRNTSVLGNSCCISVKTQWGDLDLKTVLIVNSSAESRSNINEIG